MKPTRTPALQGGEHVRISVIIGIDSGRTGALAILDCQTGSLCAIHDMPIDKVKDGTIIRNAVNGYKLTALMRGYPANGETLVVLEEPEAFPIVTRSKQTGERQTRQPSARNMRSWGKQSGTIYGVACACGYAFIDPKPKEWKRIMSIPADKAEACRIAAQRFPAFASMFTRTTVDDGRAEAALLALYGRQQVIAGKI